MRVREGFRRQLGAAGNAFRRVAYRCHTPLLAVAVYRILAGAARRGGLRVELGLAVVLFVIAPGMIAPLVLVQRVAVRAVVYRAAKGAMME